MKQTEAPITWSEAADGLRLGLSAAGAVVTLHLQNVGEAVLTVMSHVETSEHHLDWYTLFLQAGDGRGRVLRLFDDRDESHAIRARLEPGSSLQHAVKLGDWAMRAINGAAPLTGGRYQLSAAYDVLSSKAPGVWSGHLKTGPVTVILPDELL